MAIFKGLRFMHEGCGAEPVPVSDLVRGSSWKLQRILAAGASFVLSLMDKHWRPNLPLDEATLLAEKCIAEVRPRLRQRCARAAASTGCGAPVPPAPAPEPYMLRRAPLASP